MQTLEQLLLKEWPTQCCDAQINLFAGAIDSDYVSTQIQQQMWQLSGEAFALSPRLVNRNTDRMLRYASYPAYKKLKVEFAQGKLSLSKNHLFDGQGLFYIASAPLIKIGRYILKTTVLIQAIATK